jgi:hypothetical protein
MDLEAILTSVNALSFRQAIWPLPPAFALHVLEEAPQFTAWVKRYASARFRQADFLGINALGMVLTLLVCGAVPLVPHPELFMRKWSRYGCAS